MNSEQLQAKVTATLKAILKDANQSPECSHKWKWQSLGTAVPIPVLRSGARKNGSSGSPPLKAVATMACHATPKATDATSNKESAASRKARGSSASINLPTMAELATHATPRSCDGSKGAVTQSETTRRRTAAGQANLAELSLEVSGTPTTSSTTGTENPEGARGVLNPWLSLWLMGYPLTWLKCGLLAVRASRSRQRKSKGE